MPKSIRETSVSLNQNESTGSRWRARLIEGDVWGSSGFYPAKVLESDGPKTWPKGTAIFWDHPSESEDRDRPERSVKDLAGRIASTPAYESDGLYADVEFYSWAAPVVAEMAGDIGMSIRAYAEAEFGEESGRRGSIIKALHEGLSVDLVTKAGAGGKLVSLIESARKVDEASNIGHWMESRLHLALTQYADDMFGDGRLTREERIALSGAVGDALTTFATSLEGGAPQLYQRDRWAEVPAPVTETRKSASDPTNVPAPAGQPNTPNRPEEDIMGHIQVDEAEHGRLTEAAGRVPTLESERDTARAERDAAIAERDAERRTAAAGRIIDAAEASFTALERRGLLADLPVTEAGALDEEAFTVTVSAAAAESATATGAGSIRGFGQTSESSGITAQESTTSVLGAFGIPTSQEG